MDDLTNDHRFFPQISLPVPNDGDHEISGESISKEETEQQIISAASRVLGNNFKFRSREHALAASSSSSLSGSSVYNILTQLLPVLSPQSAFFWDKLCRPFSHMLVLAGYSPDMQCMFLSFIYARVLGLMGPCEGAGAGTGEKSVMTIDGSPVELSWVICTRPGNAHQAGTAPARQLRFAIEPIDPRNGWPIRGSRVLDYLTSERGGLGVVRCEEGGMQWQKHTEAFLFGDEAEGDLYVPPGTRFFIGFHFFPSGYLTLKTYHIPRARPPAVSMSKQHLAAGPALFVGDVDMSPLRCLLSHLDPRMASSFQLIMEYFASLRDERKPRFQLLSSDCCLAKNRLKIYCRTMEGTAWSDVKQSFTLGGRLTSPQATAALPRLEALWNCLFPTSSSHMDHDLGVLSAVDAQHNQVEENDPARPHAQHPVGGLLYYYELVPGTNGVFPKIYLPVRHYCENDLAISQALEKFYAQPGVMPQPPPDGWVSREVTHTFNHRPLAQKSGIQTYVTFALKKDGWDVTSYFSPECWV